MPAKYLVSVYDTSDLANGVLDSPLASFPVTAPSQDIAASKAADRYGFGSPRMMRGIEGVRGMVWDVGLGDKVLLTEPFGRTSKFDRSIGFDT